MAMAGWNTSLFISVLLVICQLAKGQQECPLNMSPCDCKYHSDNSDNSDNITASITCNGRDFVDGEQLKSVLSQPFPSNAWLSLGLDDIGFPLPENLLGDNKNINDIFFKCSSQHLPQIDPSAFAGISVSSNGHFGVAFEFCNLTGTDFQFLGSMASVQKLQFWKSNLGKLFNFPFLPSLVYLEVYEVDVEEWYPPMNTPNLRYLTFGDLGRSNVQSIIDAIPSYSSLETLRLDLNRLNDVPGQVLELVNLVHLSLAQNPLKILKRDSLKLSSSLVQLNLDDCAITDIEAEALSGDFSKTRMNLNHNSLTTFQEDVFKNVLSSMYTGTGEIVLGSSHNFACGCDIEWLIKNNRHFLERLDGVCSNGTSWNDLNPDGFDCAGH